MVKKIACQKSQFANRKSQIPLLCQYICLPETSISPKMEITLNNEPLTVEGESITVARLLELKKYTFRLRIVKINGRLISRDSYDNEVVSNGDNVSVIYLMSGG